MDTIINFLGQPIVGSIIGIAGIAIGFIVALYFYFKSKHISKLRYTINNLKLIDLNASEIPDSITMNYGDKTISTLNKTTIKIWNVGKKPILRSELSSQYIEIPFDNKRFKIVSIVVNQSSKYASVDKPIIEDNSIKLAFDFLEYKDNITVTILHDSTDIPNKILGHIIGAPDFVNISERQEELFEAVTEMITSGSTGIVEAIAGFIVNRFS